MGQAVRQDEPDLFTSAAIAEAEMLAADAEASRAEAYRRVRCASPGQVIVRRQRLAEATAAALAAEVALQRARQELGR